MTICSIFVSKKTFESIKGTTNNTTILNLLKEDPDLMIYDNEYRSITDNEKKEMHIISDEVRIPKGIEEFKLHGGYVSISLKNICPIPEITTSSGSIQQSLTQVNNSCSNKPYHMSSIYFYN